MQFRRVKSAWRTLAYVGLVIATSLILARILDALLSGDPSRIAAALVTEWLRPLNIAIGLATIPIVGAPIAIYIIWRWYRWHERVR